jgi:hypothetical protein
MVAHAYKQFNGDLSFLYRSQPGSQGYTLTATHGVIRALPNRMPKVQWFHKAAKVLCDIPSTRIDCLLSIEYSADAERGFRNLTTEARTGDESRRGRKRLR